MLWKVISQSRRWKGGGGDEERFRGHLRAIHERIAKEDPGFLSATDPLSAFPRLLAWNKETIRGMLLLRDSPRGTTTAAAAAAAAAAGESATIEEVVVLVLDEGAADAAPPTLDELLKIQMEEREKVLTPYGSAAAGGGGKGRTTPS